MMIKFLARGTGSAAAAADYLTREGSPEAEQKRNAGDRWDRVAGRIESLIQQARTRSRGRDFER